MTAIAITCACATGTYDTRATILSTGSKTSTAYALNTCTTHMAVSVRCTTGSFDTCTAICVTSGRPAFNTDLSGLALTDDPLTIQGSNRPRSRCISYTSNTGNGRFGCIPNTQNAYVTSTGTFSVNTNITQSDNTGFTGLYPQNRCCVAYTLTDNTGTSGTTTSSFDASTVGSSTNTINTCINSATTAKHARVRSVFFCTRGRSFPVSNNTTSVGVSYSKDTDTPITRTGWITTLTFYALTTRVVSIIPIPTQEAATDTPRAHSS
jgi:hypothetical protein